MQVDMNQKTIRNDHEIFLILSTYRKYQIIPDPVNENFIYSDYFNSFVLAESNNHYFSKKSNPSTIHEKKKIFSN